MSFELCSKTTESDVLHSEFTIISLFITLILHITFHFSFLPLIIAICQPIFIRIYGYGTQ